jgi:hypothetical protein
MRHPRQFTALLAIAAITVACGSSPGASSGGESSQGSEPSTGSQPSQAAASTGGGGGANGSITYEITGDYEASGELPFLAGSSSWIESANGWVANFADPAGGGAVISLNTQEGQTIGQGLSYGDGSVTVIAASDSGGGTDCTFTLDKNDADGLKGHVECSSAFAVDNNDGSQKNVQFNAQWDAHP